MANLGYYLEPTILFGKNNMRVFREILPVLAVQPPLKPHGGGAGNR